MVVPVTTIRRGTVPRRMAGTVAGHDMGAGAMGHGYRDLVLRDSGRGHILAGDPGCGRTAFDSDWISRVATQHTVKTMRLAAIAVVSLLAAFAAAPAGAEVPNSITALLGPTVGYLLAQSDLCQWGLNEKIEKTYRDGFKTIGMTAAQQATAWAQAAARRKALADLPAEAKTRMKADTCAPAARARVESDLAD
jgi:hypothetical protein